MNICHNSTREDFKDIRSRMGNIFLHKVTEIACKGALYDKYRNDPRFFIDVRKCHITGKVVVYVVGMKNLHVCTCGEDMYLNIRPAKECWYSREYPEDNLEFVGIWRCPRLRIWNAHIHKVHWDRVIVSKTGFSILEVVK